MAEAAAVDEKQKTLPAKGQVENVCKQFAVHEDGVLAYKLQNEEKDFHYGLNRFNRRTVREDIPIAKIVQSEEEIRQQEERMQQLLLLRTQSQEDEKVAQSVLEEIKAEESVDRIHKELQDEDIARKIQEKEKRRYDRWKREQQLKKERERLEQELARHAEEARLVVAIDGRESESPADARTSPSSRDSDPAHRGNTRLMSTGRLEDEGDFSDFYVPPADHMDEGEKRQLQELQDEELARLIQEQEHKRTKAEVDKDKLRQIEQRDAELARIIHEQDKLKARKAKQRKQKSLEEARRQRAQAAAQRSQSVDDRGHVGDRDRDPGDSPSSPSLRAPGSGSRPLREHNSPTSRRADNTSSSPQSAASSLSNSHREHNGLHKDQVTSQRMSPNVSPGHRGQQQQGGSRSRGDPHEDVTPGRRDRDRGHPRNAIDSHYDLQRRLSPVDLPPEDIHEVERWLGRSAAYSKPPAIQHTSPPPRLAEPLPASSSPPGSYHSEEGAPPNNVRRNVSRTSSSQRENRDESPVPFNIAMAIDPTYRPDRPRQEDPRPDYNDPRPPVTQSRSYPISSSHNAIEDEEDEEDEDSWVPVQGQKRSTLDKRHKQQQKKPNPKGGPKKGSSCKQQ